MLTHRDMCDVLAVPCQFTGEVEPVVQVLFGADTCVESRKRADGSAGELHFRLPRASAPGRRHTLSWITDLGHAPDAHVVRLPAPCVEAVVFTKFSAGTMPRSVRVVGKRTAGAGPSIAAQLLSGREVALAFRRLAPGNSCGIRWS